MGATARGMMTNFEVQTLAGRQPHDHAGQSNCRRPPRPPLRRATDKQQQRGDNPWFQSTPPIRRATYLIPSFDVLYLFRSTPTMGRATGEWRIISHGHCFNPRPPCGGRHLIVAPFTRSIGFQSTPPMRRATGKLAHRVSLYPVSIHAPMRRATCWVISCKQSIQPFQSTPPCGGTTVYDPIL